MRNSRFTESRIVAILKEGEAGVALSEVTRKHGISRATYFKASEVRRGGRSGPVDFGLIQVLRSKRRSAEPPFDPFSPKHH